jgi:DNA-binding NarL/FixJ family response regulator
MNLIAKLTSRETEIAELFAWGAAKKEVADRLNVSERTVENHARNIYEKTGCGKVTNYLHGGFARSSVSHSICRH